MAKSASKARKRSRPRKRKKTRKRSKKKATASRKQRPSRSGRPRRASAPSTPSTSAAEHLALARIVQRGLLPPPSFELPGFELAMRNLHCEQLGGDFCDYFALKNNALGLYLGDVQGKGVGAALHALLVSGVLRGMHKSGQSPADVVCLLNQRVTLRNLPERFSCIVYAVIGLDDSRLTFASAGVPFPLLLRDGKVRRLELTGRPVGMFEVSHYDEMTVVLEPGDTLLFHSDGVAESLTPPRHDVPDGQARLERRFARCAGKSAAEIADTLITSLEGNGKRKRSIRDVSTFIVVLAV